MNLEVASPALSPDVLETITAQVTQRVTATIRDELTALINNINSNSASNSQGSISINPLVASNNDDNDRLVTESRHLDNAIQHSVEAVVVDHTEKIAGKCPTGFVSTAVPIDARVSDQTKSKIWSNQYIEFSSLLSKDKRRKGKFSLQVEDGDSPGQLTIHQVENDSQNEVTFSSMHDWLTAWNIFAAIYCMKYPEQQSKLAKHLETVRDIADAKGNWKAYDTDFRMLVAQGQVSWGDIHMELYVNARLTTALPSKPNKSHKDICHLALCQEVSVSSTIQVSIVQQACLVASNIDVITAAGHTHLFSVQSKPSSPFVSCRSIKTMQVVQIQENNSINQNQLLHPSKGPTPIKVNRLTYWLSGYDEDETYFLVQGFTNGFYLGFVGECPGIESKNLNSALTKPEIIDKKIQKEISAGRVQGPFENKPFSNLQCSPLGLVEKKEPGEFRMIHHLSYPENQSINDGIPPDESFVQYSSISDAIHFIKKCGKSAFCCKTDIKSAFRIINIHQSQY